MEGLARPRRSVVLLPGSRGFNCPRTRSLADRIAVFCFALVLVPDLLRGEEPWPEGQTPQQRIAADLRTSAIYLRADHRIGPIALLGTGLGGSLVLRALAAEGSSPLAIGAAGGVALCPPRPRRDELEALHAPTLLLFDRATTSDDEAARIARERLGLQQQTDEPPQESLAQLRRLRVADLRARLAGYGLSTEGRKAELIERLQTASVVANKQRPRGHDAEPEAAHAVMQFAGLQAQCGLGESQHNDQDEDHHDKFSSSSRACAEEAEDGMIMAEAWVNLHLDRATEDRV
jgi:hypothetical protein